MKKTLDYYMSLPYSMEIIPDPEDGSFAVRYPDLPGCFTCAASLNQAIANAQDAKLEWLQAALDENLIIKEPESTPDIASFSGQFKIRLPKTLHRALSVHAKKEGISMNQYCIYLLAKGDAEYDSGKVQKIINKNYDDLLAVAERV